MNPVYGLRSVARVRFGLDGQLESSPLLFRPIDAREATAQPLGSINPMLFSSG